MSIVILYRIQLLTIINDKIFIILQGENARLTDQQREKERALHIKDDRIKELEARLQEKDLVLCQKESNLQRIQAELQNLQV